MDSSIENVDIDCTDVITVSITPMSTPTLSSCMFSTSSMTLKGIKSGSDLVSSDRGLRMLLTTSLELQPSKIYIFIKTTYISIVNCNVEKILNI